jgi:hypothetical protein
MLYLNVLFREEELPPSLTPIEALRAAIVQEVLVVGPYDGRVRGTEK